MSHPDFVSAENTTTFFILLFVDLLQVVHKLEKLPTQW